MTGSIPGRRCVIYFVSMVLERGSIALFGSERYERAGQFVRVAYGCEHKLFKNKIEEVASLIEEMCKGESSGDW